MPRRYRPPPGSFLYDGVPVVTIERLRGGRFLVTLRDGEVLRTLEIAPMDLLRIDVQET